MLIAIDAHNLEKPRTGVGVYLFNLLREWAKEKKLGQISGIDFLLYFKKEIPADILELNGFRVKIIKASFGVQSNTLFSQWLVGRAAKKDKANILFSPNYTLPFFGDGMKSAVTIHDIIYEARPDLYNWPGILDKMFLRKNVQRSAKKAGAIFTPSNFTKQEIIKYYNIDAEKIFVTPLAVSDDFLRESDKDKIKEIKEKYGISDKYIICVGSIFSRRHIPEIIEAFKKVFSRFANCQFFIIGENHTRPRLNIEKIILETNKILRDISKNRNVSPIIYRHFIEHRDLFELYKNATVSIYLSDYEGFGLPLLESMASGTPVITSKQLALMETAGDAAMFIDNNNDIDEISKKITLILSDNDLCQKLIQKGLDQINKFNWSRCAAQTLDIFKKIADK